MPIQTTPQIILPHFSWSLARLKEVIEKEDTEYYRGTALQRFTLTYEVALKAIRAFAKEEGKNVSTDESCFQWVEEKQWLEKQINWIRVIQSYNKVKTSQEKISKNTTYNELQAHYSLLNNIKESMITTLSKKI
jgi:hypothetical protein